MSHLPTVGLGRARASLLVLVLGMGTGGCAALGGDGRDEGIDPEAFAAETAAAAEAHIAAGDYAAALERYDAAIAEHPGVVALYGERANLALEAGRTDEALADLRTAARLAAEADQPERAAFYGELITEIVERPPGWVERRLDAAHALPEGEATQGALEFWQATRGEAMTLARQGDLQGAVMLGEDALDLAEQSFGPEHALTITSLRDLADLLFAAGDPVGAETVLMLALERASAALGEGHPQTLEIQATLADLYESQGRAEDALAMSEEAAVRAEEALGVEQPRTQALRTELARRLEAVGEYAFGAEILEAACDDQEQLFGRWHPSTAACLEQYGILLGRGGDLPGARDAFAETLTIRRGVLGPDAPATLRTRLDLASIQRRQGELEAALAELEALAGAVDTDAVVAADPALATDVAESRARVLLDLGRTEDAAPLAREVLEARRATLGEEHPLTLDALNLLGAIYLREGRLLAAEEAWTAVLEGYRDLYGVENLATVTAMANLGVVLEKQGVYDRAEPMLRTAEETAENLLGPAHPQTLNAMNNLALLHEAQGDFQRAEPLYLLPLEVLGSTLGAEHPRTIAVMNNLAFLYMMMERYPEASEMFAQAHQAWANVLGPDHQDTLKALNNRGRVQRRQGELEAAEANIGEALDARRRTLGPRHLDTLRSMSDLGAVYADQGRLDEAEALLEETLDLNEQVLGTEHPYTFETLNRLGEVLEAQGRLREAVDLRRAGFERRSRFLDKMLWVTSDNAREGYIRLHRPELDDYLQLLPEIDPATGGRELLEVALQRKGLLLSVSSQVQRIADLGLDAQTAALAEQLVAAREELASLTLSGPGETEPVEHLQQIRDLEFEVDQLQGELGRASLRYRETVTEVTAQDLFDRMEPGSALVDFLVYARDDGSRGLLAGVLRKDADGGVATELVSYPDMDEVTGIIQEYREIIQYEGAGDDEVAEIGEIAWEIVWAPLVENLPEDGPVYLVPDGVLNVLPFAALVDPDGEHLVDTTELHLLSSSRDLLPSRLPRAEGDYMIVAGPDYDTEAVAGEETLAAARSRRAARRSVAAPEPLPEGEQPEFEPVLPGSGTRGSGAARFEAMRGLSVADLEGRSAAILASLRAASSGLRGLSFSPLPGAELEGTLITRQVDGAGDEPRMYSRGEAEEAVLNGLAGPPRVLHLATHGFFLEADDALLDRLKKAQRSSEIQVPPPGDNPLLRAGLAFAGINSNAPFLGELDTRNDGVLTALEVLSLDLTGTELAVLSACETGLGEIHEGEGVYGLRRAFEEAGVDQVVVSLWEVSDAGTQALMTAMYDRLLAGMSPREALRDAQRELKRSPRWGYPFVWAAFTIVGG